MEHVKVVVHYANGKIIKGYTNNFFPNKPLFHFNPVETELTDKGIEISIKELKAVFFVKDFTGNPAYREKKHFNESRQTSGRKVEVTFVDGEVLAGSTLGYDPTRTGFFVTPSDIKSNNLRVFVVSTSVSKFRYL